MKSPIESLHRAITHAFENPNGSVLPELRQAIAEGRVNSEINLNQERKKPKTPFAVHLTGEPALISLHVPYLEMLWSFIYGWFVIYEECVQRKMLEGTFHGSIEYDTPLKQRAAKLLDWSASLKQSCTDWPDELPSPTSFADTIEEEFTKKTNAIFLHSVAYLLHHEYAHIRQGHADALKDRSGSALENMDAKSIEREADEFAFSMLIAQTDNDQVRRLKGWGILAPALSSLYLFHSPDGLFQNRHPHVHHRIQESISRLNYASETNRFYFEYLCIAVLSVVRDSYNGFSASPVTYETTAEALELILDELDKLNPDESA